MITKLPHWMEGLEELGIRIKKRMRSVGLIAFDLNEIWIKNALPYEEKVKTLIHELLHYYYDEIKKRKWKNCSEKDEEEYIERQTEKIYRSLEPSERGIIEFVLSEAKAA